MAIDLTAFLDVPFKVQQGGASPRTEAEITRGDEVVLTQDSPTEYTITVTTKNPPLVFAPLTLDEFANLGGDLAAAPNSDRIVRVSFYKQEGPEPLKVLFGTIIDTDPDSVGAWSADDQGP